MPADVSDAEWRGTSVGTEGGKTVGEPLAYPTSMLPKRQLTAWRIGYSLLKATAKRIYLKPDTDDG